MYLPLSPEQEADAQVCAKGDGVAIRGGDDAADQHPEGQPGIAAGAAEQDALRVQVQVREKEQVSALP